MLLRLSELDLSLALSDLMLKLSTLLQQLMRRISTFHPPENLIFILLNRLHFYLLAKVFEFLDLDLAQFRA